MNRAVKPGSREAVKPGSRAVNARPATPKLQKNSESHLRPDMLLLPLGSD